MVIGVSSDLKAACHDDCKIRKATKQCMTQQEQYIKTASCLYHNLICKFIFDYKWSSWITFHVHFIIYFKN